MGQRLSLMIGVINGTNVNTFSKIFDFDGIGELYRGGLSDSVFLFFKGTRRNCT